MSRVWSSGFELNSKGGVDSFKEWDADSGTSAFSIQSTVKRSGTYAGKISSMTSGQRHTVAHDFAASSAETNGILYFRVYMRFDTLPTAENTFVTMQYGTTADMVGYLTISSSGTIRLYDEDGVIGSPSAALNTGQWYRVEWMFNRTGAAGSHEMRARIDGQEFAGASNRNFSRGMNAIRLGGNLRSETQTQGVWYFDDFAGNNTSGSNQNSYPGAGKIIHLHPNAVGDNTGWSRGGSDSGSNWGQVDEVKPNDVTDYVLATTTVIDDYNLEASGLSSLDVINVVAVAARYRAANVGDTISDYVLRVKASAGGTVEESSVIAPNSTTWRSFMNSTPKSYPITIYDLPGASSTPWTAADLDVAQIGIRLSTARVYGIWISTVWMLVEYQPTLTKNLTDSLTLVGSLTKALGRTLTGALILVSSLTKQIGITKIATLTLVDSLKRTITKSWSEVITLVGSVASEFLYPIPLLLTDSLTLVDSITWLVTKATGLIRGIARDVGFKLGIRIKT